MTFFDRIFSALSSKEQMQNLALQNFSLGWMWYNKNSKDFMNESPGNFLKAHPSRLRRLSHRSCSLGRAPPSQIVRMTLVRVLGALTTIYRPLPKIYRYISKIKIQQVGFWSNKPKLQLCTVTVFTIYIQLACACHVLLDFSSKIVSTT